MRIFPNPTELKNGVTITFDEALHGEVSITLYNSHDQRVYYECISNAKALFTHQLHLQHLDRGAYVIKVSWAGKSGVQKLIVL